MDLTIMMYLHWQAWNEPEYIDRHYLGLLDSAPDQAVLLLHRMHEYRTELKQELISRPLHEQEYLAIDKMQLVMDELINRIVGVVSADDEELF